MAGGRAPNPKRRLKARRLADPVTRGVDQGKRGE
jgi:hypothetical protein